MLWLACATPCGSPAKPDQRAMPSNLWLPSGCKILKRFPTSVLPAVQHRVKATEGGYVGLYEGEKSIAIQIAHGGRKCPTTKATVTNATNPRVQGLNRRRKLLVIRHGRRRENRTYLIDESTHLEPRHQRCQSHVRKNDSGRRNAPRPRFTDQSIRHY